jgi:hypothetical protein
VAVDRSGRPRLATFVEIADALDADVVVVPLQRPSTQVLRGRSAISPSSVRSNSVGYC